MAQVNLTLEPFVEINGVPVILAAYTRVDEYQFLNSRHNLKFVFLRYTVVSEYKGQMLQQGDRIQTETLTVDTRLTLTGFGIISPDKKWLCQTKFDFELNPDLGQKLVVGYNLKASRV